MADIPKYTELYSLHSLHHSEQGPDSVNATPRRPWQPGFFKRLPWTGVLSIILALGCGIAAISLGLKIDGKRFDYWTVGGYVVQPAVLLSVLATVANALLVFAFAKGATIHWWHSAVRGATLEQLHSSWAFGSDWTAIFTSVAAFNTVALAAVFMPILLADGPLLQRAVVVVTTPNVTHTNQTIPLSPSPFLSGGTAFFIDHAAEPSLYHPLFAKVVQQYTAREPILVPTGLCNGNCELEVSAPGWDIECDSSATQHELATYDDLTEYLKNTDSNYTEYRNSTYRGPEVDQIVFNVELTYGYDYPANYEDGVNFAIDLETRYKSTPGGNYTLSRHSCTLHEAIIKYPLVLQNETVTLAPMPLSDGRTVERVYRGPESGSIGTYETLLIFNVDGQILMANEIAFRTAYAQTSMTPSGDSSVNLTATQSYILKPNLTGIDRPLVQRAVVTDKSTQTVYQTQPGWLAGGFVVICLACLFIAPTYWGFWRLGREVSMSPIEIGRAFDAAVMQNADPNATGQDLKKYLGDRKVNLAPAAIQRSRSTMSLGGQPEESSGIIR
ncbi:uncharacterized protein LTR77_009089 [Saxophila tyrrhenica]|uniref:Uncharacterized protein n=1 Tax=Saxophila tyrrhenica TaxID=1690608 RepID=A0AAV9NZR3_9PEZI|nr:hypothetical protein LTR77_009089 [Saxophila tyrrhenica]